MKCIKTEKLVFVKNVSLVRISPILVLYKPYEGNKCALSANSQLESDLSEQVSQVTCVDTAWAVHSWACFRLF